jgi:type I restriction enzyme, S subunit
MELMAKQGFKHTEVGLIPEDWEIVKFNEIGDAIIGLTYSPKDVNSSGKLVHRSSNIQSNKLAYYDNVYVTCDVPEKLILKE